MTHDHMRLLIADWDVRDNARTRSLFEPLVRALRWAWARVLRSEAEGRERISVPPVSARWLEQLEHELSKHPDRR